MNLAYDRKTNEAVNQVLADRLYDPRKMSVKTQIAFISRQLKNKGIEPDSVDIQALIDPTLSYRENYKLIMESLGKGKSSNYEGIINNPACDKVKDLKREIKEHQKADTELQDMKAELKEAKQQCGCSECQQMGLYDLEPRAPYGIPPGWFNFMLRSIRRVSDIDNPALIVIRIWRRKSPYERIQIRRREAKG